MTPNFKIKSHALKAHSGALYALAPGRTDETVFTAGADRVVAEWSFDADEPNPFAIRVDATVYSLLNIDRHTLLIGTSKGSIHVVDLASKKEIRHLKLHDQGIFHLLYDTENKRVYASSSDGTVSVWNAKEWSLLWHLQITSEKVRRTALNANGDLVAICSGDGRALIIETINHRVIHEIDAHADSCNSMAFLPNGDLLTGGKDAYLRRWSRNQGFAMVKEIPAHNFAVYDIIVNAPENWIATASRDKTVKLWDMSLEHSPQRLDRKNFGGHINSVNGLALIDDKHLVSCSDDRSAIVWNIQSA